MVAVLSVWEFASYAAVTVAALFVVWCFTLLWDWMRDVNDRLSAHRETFNDAYNRFHEHWKELQELKKKLESTGSLVNSLHNATRDVIQSFEIDNERDKAQAKIIPAKYQIFAIEPAYAHHPLQVGLFVYGGWATEKEAREFFADEIGSLFDPKTKQYYLSHPNGSLFKLMVPDFQTQKGNA